MKNHSNTWVILIFTALFLLTSGISVHAAQVADKKGIRLEWSSKNKNRQQLGLAFEQLYVTLYNTGTLPVRVIRDRAKTKLPIIQLLKSEKLFFGADFPDGLDSVMCDINPLICSRKKSATSKKTLSSITSHVGGYKKSVGAWRNGKATKTVVVPDLDFKVYTSIEEIPYHKGINIRSLLEEREADCSKWGMSCYELVSRLNRVIFADKTHTANTQMTIPSKIKVPTLTYETSYVIGDIGNGAIKKATKDLKLPKVRYSQRKNSIRRYKKKWSKKWSKYLNKRNAADENVKALRYKVQSFGKANSLGYGDTLFANRNNLLNLIKHPFFSNDSIEDNLKEKIKIAVFDFRVHEKHCEFRDKVNFEMELAATDLSEPDREEPTQCGNVMTYSPTKPDDHGTHILGLISSAKNDAGIVGLNPFAKTTYVALDSVALQDPQYRKKVGEKILTTGLIEKNKVINISWKYVNSTSSDAIKDGMSHLKENTLIVIAVNNRNKVHYPTGTCNEFPSCYHNLDNVITVVGLDRNLLAPKLWKNSETGSDSGVEFSIGAIAPGILSTTYGNHTGKMSGTSQSAPQVTAAASLIYSRYKADFIIENPILLPVRVKNRLIYTSDLFNKLLATAQGGRLNIEKALDMSHEFIKIRVNGIMSTYRGDVLKFGNSENLKCLSRTNPILFKDIRRMFYDTPRNTYVVFYNAKSGDRDSKLLRITNCKIATQGAHKVKFFPESAEENVEFKIREIRDYISRMF